MLFRRALPEEEKEEKQQLHELSSDMGSVPDPKISEKEMYLF